MEEEGIEDDPDETSFWTGLGRILFLDQYSERNNSRKITLHKSGHRRTQGEYNTVVTELYNITHAKNWVMMMTISWMVVLRCSIELLFYLQIEAYAR